MVIIYRISDLGYEKEKPNYINNENCLKNASLVFPPTINKWVLIADNISDETYKMVLKYIPKKSIKLVSKGNGAQTFNIALDEALKLDDEEIVYFIENDYLHKPNSKTILQDGFNLGADYMTLYVHPDKFISPEKGGNPEVDTDGGYLTKLYKGKYELFWMVNSTTMTFGSKVKTLKEDESILRKWIQKDHPQDYQMFLELRDKGKVLLCPSNSYSTHGETKWLAPFINWEQIKLD